MRRIAIASLSTVFMILGLAAPGSAGPRSTSHAATQATVRSGADDVLLSDGINIYRGRELATTRIIDYDQTVDPDSPDEFQFSSDIKRRMVYIHSTHIDDGEPVACSFHNRLIFTTTRAEAFDWYHHMAPGSIERADAYFRCFADESGFGPDSRRFRVNYPDGPDECALIERLDATRWRFSVPSYDSETKTGCEATLTTTVSGRGQDDVTTVDYGVSAPLELTVVIPT
jgi:hypothetical protein